jgi:hypothetical protein
MPTPTNTRSTSKGASAAGGTTALATLLVWVLGHFHVALSAEDGALIAGALSTAVLFVWHYGVRNILRHLAGGDSKQPAATS